MPPLPRAKHQRLEPTSYEAVGHMRRAISVVILTLAIALGAWLAFGWPGEMILLALAPGLILGTVLAHVVDAWIGRCQLRLAFVMLGTVLGTFSTMVALLFMGAATVPSEVRIEEERWLGQPPSFVWGSVGEPTRWSRWDAWLGRIEPVPSDTPGIKAYDATLIMGTTEVPARHRIKERTPNERFVWTIELAPGSAFTNIEQSVNLSAEGEGTRVTYTISYELPSVTGRALHALLFKQGLEMTAQEALEGLEMVVRARDET